MIEFSRMEMENNIRRFQNTGILCIEEICDSSSPPLDVDKHKLTFLNVHQLERQGADIRTKVEAKNQKYPRLSRAGKWITFVKKGVRIIDRMSIFWDSKVWSIT
jgi:hypothetical protein